MAMAEGAVGTATESSTFALDVHTPNNIPPNTTISAFAVRRGAGDQKDALFVFVSALDAAKTPQLPSLLLKRSA